LRFGPSPRRELRAVHFSVRRDFAHRRKGRDLGHIEHVTQVRTLAFERDLAQMIDREIAQRMSDYSAATAERMTLENIDYARNVRGPEPDLAKTRNLAARGYG